MSMRRNSVLNWKLCVLLRRQWRLILLVLYTVGFIKCYYIYNAVINDNLSLTSNNIQQLQDWRGFSQTQKSSLSVLGEILYLDKPYPKPRNKEFTILVHKHGEFLERRHLRNFGSKKTDPFATCSVQNCHLTYQNSDLEIADAVIVHLHRTCSMKDLPNEAGERPPGQKWIFLTDEAPTNAFLCAKPLTPMLDGMFNWSMSYRYDADIPVAYGRTVLRKEPIQEDVHQKNIEKLLEKKKYLAAIMISNCQQKSLRWRYVQELAKHMPLTILGACGNSTMCRGQLHYGIDCPELEQFKFYLSFENQLCDHYITEKVWWNAFGKGAIPVVMGGDDEGKTYSQFLPPGSYLTVDDFSDPAELAKCLQGDCASEQALRSFHDWRRLYDVKQEHAYFGSPSVHYCRVCEALNYNAETPKVYEKFSEALRTDVCRSNINYPY